LNPKPKQAIQTIKRLGL